MIIDDYASLGKCVKLTDIQFPASFKRIDDRDFFHCTSLKVVNFIPSLKRILSLRLLPKVNKIYW